MVPALIADSGTRRLGFWVQMPPPFSNQIAGLTPDVWAKAMFLTPPYPSTAELMFFGPANDLKAAKTPATAYYSANELKYLDGILTVSDQYPNIKINVMVAIGNMTNPISLQFFQYYIDNLKSHPSIGGIGIEGEYTNNINLVLMTQAMQQVTSAGKLFINYYVKPSSLIPLGGFQIFHTNWPNYQKEAELAFSTSSPTIGISAGYYATFPFPETRTIPADPKISVDGYGWQQADVSKVLDYSLKQPANSRQFVDLTVGKAIPFIGVSGVIHTDLWDNPILRNWIWTDPNYQGNFILSTTPSSTSSVSTTSSASSSSQSPGEGISSTTMETGSLGTTNLGTTQAAILLLVIAAGAYVISRIRHIDEMI